LKYKNPLQELLRQLNKSLPHHSTGDWDYSDNNWTLDSTDYVSAPSSLFRTAAAGYTSVLVKTSTVPIAQVKEGRIDTYAKMYTDTLAVREAIRIVFRWQDDNNYYYVVITPNSANLYWEIDKKVAGVITTIASGNISLGYDDWQRYRVTWWNDYVGLVIRFEYWNGSQWVKVYDAYDSANLWKATGGRVGFYLANTLGAPNYTKIDDSNIYGAG